MHAALLLLVGIATAGSSPAFAEQTAKTPPPSTASAETMHCAQAQVVVDGILETASARIESARQTNNPPALRSTVDDLQSALRDARAQLAACAPAATEAHAGHATRAVAAPSSGTPPAAKADPHGAHSATPSIAAPATADPHAGHTAHAAESPQTAPPARQGEAARIEEWLKGYDTAFIAKDLEKLATFYHPDVTIYEGAGVNNGWIDYRDRHLGPELKAFDNLEFGHSNRRVHMLGDAAAYVISEYFIKAKMKDRVLDNIGRETLVLEKQADGTWKIRHSHTSGRARPVK